MPTIGSFSPPKFGTIFLVTDASDKPQRVQSTSIYDVATTDRTHLSEAAVAGDKTLERNAYQDKYGAYIDPLPFVFKHHVYIATGDAAAKINDYTSDGRALGIYGKDPKTISRRIEKTCAGILKLTNRKTTKRALPFRPIQEKRPPVKTQAISLANSWWQTWWHTMLGWLGLNAQTPSSTVELRDFHQKKE
jgi:hypothetical protein